MASGEPEIPALLIAEEAWPEGTFDPSIRVISQVPLDQVIIARGAVGPDTQIAIVDMRAGTRRDVIVAALLLRNHGRMAIVCGGTAIPHDLIVDVAGALSAGRVTDHGVRAEVLLTDEAMNYLGDISDVVRYFEQEFLR